MTAFTFVVCLIGFALVGAASTFRSKGTTEDYYLAGQNVSPWLAGLSAVATNNSGYMFIGMIGLTYTTGWSSIWLMVGWIAGDMMASAIAFRKLRAVSDAEHVRTYSSLLSHWHGVDQVLVRRLVAVVTVLFLSVYAAAQLKAGGKALFAILGWHQSAGAVIGAVIVLAYSIAGGIRASIWTDAAQSFVMMGAMLIMMVVGIDAAGGVGPTLQRLNGVSPDFMDWFEGGFGFAALLGVVGWLAAGMGVLGQPHIMVRFMAVSDIKYANRIRGWYYGWFILFYAATMVVGLLTRLLLPVVANFDAELALPQLAQELLPPSVVGIVLAGLFAATISTADSLVLVCSSAISIDLKENLKSLRSAKIGTVVALSIALVIAVSGNKTVFRLVLDAWGMLGSAFAPLLLLYARNRILSERAAIATILSGPAVFVAWSLSGGIGDVYAILPAIIVGLAVGFALSKSSAKNLSVEQS